MVIHEQLDGARAHAFGFLHVPTGDDLRMASGCVASVASRFNSDYETNTMRKCTFGNRLCSRNFGVEQDSCCPWSKLISHVQLEAREFLVADKNRIRFAEILTMI